MNAKSIRALTALVVLASAASAHAEYKCKAPPSRVDARACEEAMKGADDLRRFIQRMGWMKVNLQFSDYVDRATVLAWEAERAREALASAETPVESVPAPTR